MSFVTVQAFAFIFYGEYPGVTLRPPSEQLLAEIYMWLVVAGSLLLVVLVNVVAAKQSIREFFTRGAWLGEVVFEAFHKFCHLCLAWSLLLSSYWMLAELYDPGTSESIWALTNSITYSIISILVVWILSVCERRFHAPQVIIEGFVWAISLLLGYSWKLVFTEAQNAVLHADNWGLRILTSAMNFGLMIPVYFRYILPKMEPPTAFYDRDTQTAAAMLRCRSAAF
ncbi:hypothetical protein FOL47_010886 [Perkinsus chesapeaki]|uniref:Uncharacterized protein n=1 Tax=Perkinsus chesapeaki TaxID=330153 RepID=A0A7J6MPD7_PERCH|nr:hypothetical protein FOL47_010886 [Perkinsus chesapeaki]